MDIAKGLVAGAKVAAGLVVGEKVGGLVESKAPGPWLPIAAVLGLGLFLGGRGGMLRGVGTGMIACGAAHVVGQFAGTAVDLDFTRWGS